MRFTKILALVGTVAVIATGCGRAQAPTPQAEAPQTATAETAYPTDHSKLLESKFKEIYNNNSSDLMYSSVSVSFDKWANQYVITNRTTVNQSTAFFDNTTKAQLANTARQICNSQIDCVKALDPTATADSWYSITDVNGIIIYDDVVSR